MDKMISLIKKKVWSIYYNDYINDDVPVYKTRKSKAVAVYKKYKAILKGDVLDVGADQLYLKKYLPVGVNYTGIGLGNHRDLVKVDLEKSKIPYKDNSFDCVLCLDVLEHVDNIHEVFDELCRVSRKWIIISLPNPWAELVGTIRSKKYSKKKYMKFYGLPVEREEDRHKWFFSSTEAQNFIKYRSNKNKFKINELLVTNDVSRFAPIQSFRIKLAKVLLFRKDLDLNDLYSNTLWWILEKKS